MFKTFQPKNMDILYSCVNCNYITSRKSQYARHLLTAKHQKLSFLTENVPNVPKMKEQHKCCECDKNYSTRGGLWYHRKLCKPSIIVTSEETCKNDLIKQLIIQNQQLIFENKEFKELILDQSNKMMELATKPSNSTVNTNCHNKQFNLNVFLNEKCKNAMNMKDFINSIEIMDDDFENIGRLGYIQGISNIFMKGLKDLNETERPMHCSDIKRETIYIKDDDVWNKDVNNERIIEAINGVSHKNVKYIPIWKDANPTATDTTSKKNDQYMQIVNQVMTSITPDDPNAINKIIRNVANLVVIDKKSV